MAHTSKLSCRLIHLDYSQPTKIPILMLVLFKDVKNEEHIRNVTLMVSKDVRAWLFLNGEYLKSNKLISPSGKQLDQHQHLLT